eukprot:GHVH01015729.1.p1 GENE.GHVH01015729.1~~GHVH01015729.1.p1  ORF type:complete len:177 (-),score=41.60 GHVH01015729.1:225-755(-)
MHSCFDHHRYKSLTTMTISSITLQADKMNTQRSGGHQDCDEVNRKLIDKCKSLQTELDGLKDIIKEHQSTIKQHELEENTMKELKEIIFDQLEIETQQLEKPTTETVEEVEIHFTEGLGSDGLKITIRRGEKEVLGLVDTGASVSVFRESDVSALGLKKTDRTVAVKGWRLLLMNQ